ncbi:uncharacterized protein LOC128080036 [Tympanuchus pallidicinctus]|uniref:uncharacterized protein LOC128080036 n=1 Tax=Tympanuchus pallidicinctus TaxID=109042 RepID=UPI00228700C4|nr:uncharacterized protein LOC128080036 [Tympanuchus pallidicinctus]
MAEMKRKLFCDQSNRSMKLLPMAGSDDKAGQESKSRTEQPRRPVPADHRSPPEPAAATLPPPRRSTFPCVPRAAGSSALRRRHAADWPPAAPPLSPPPPPAPLPGFPLSGQPPARPLAPAFSRPPPVPPRGEAPPVRRLAAAVGRSCSRWLRIESAVCVMKGCDLSRAKRELSTEAMNAA